MEQQIPNTNTTPGFPGTVARIAGLAVALAGFGAAAQGASVAYTLFAAFAFIVGVHVGTLLDMATPVGGNHA